MSLLRYFLLGMFQIMLNLGISMGFVFGAVILLRPLTNRLLRPRYRVTFWMAAWLVSWSWSFYDLLGKIRVLPFTFRGWLTPRFEANHNYAAYVPRISKAGDYSIALPGGAEIPFSVTEGMLNIVALLVFLGFVCIIWWSGREEGKIKRLSRRGDPMDEDWNLAHGVKEEGVTVRILPDLPASFVCRVAPGVHNICLQQELPPERMELILRHELAHVRGRHVWFKGFMMALTCLFWWNPLCWAACRLACRDVELACDEAVLRELEPDKRREYARMLVELGSGRHLWGGLTCFGECDAAVRVKHAVKWTREPRWVKAVVWPALVLAFLFFFTLPAETVEEKTGGLARAADYVLSEKLEEDLGRFAGWSAYHLVEIWQRDQTLLVLDEDGQWHLCSFKFYDELQEYRINSYTRVDEPGKYQFVRVK